MANKRQLEIKLDRPNRIRLGKMWGVGIASGSAGELDMKKLRSEARARLRQIKPRPVAG
jgi:hypothetical protein